MRINSISGINNREGFTSKIEYEQSSLKKGLDERTRSYIERFDDMSEFQKERITRVIKEDQKFVTYYLPNLNLTIKEQKSKTPESKYGPLTQENLILTQHINKAIKDTPHALAYVATESGGKYLVSKPVHEILTLNRIGKLEPKTMESILKQLNQADINGIQLQNLKNENILKSANNKAFLMDFQDAGVTKNGIFFARYEARNNMNVFEGQFLVPYLDKLPKDEARQTLKTYLQLKSKYCEKLAHDLKKTGKKDKDIRYLKQAEFEKAKAYVYKNPTDEVLDLELMKMYMYNFDFKRASYFDKTVQTPRNILNAVKYAVWTDIMACKLYGYEPEKMPKKAEAIEYFTNMNELGYNWESQNKGCSDETAQIKDIFRGKADSTNLLFPNELRVPNVEDLPCNRLLVTVKPDARAEVIKEFCQQLLNIYKENN